VAVHCAQLFNLIGQPVSWEKWQKALHQKPINNHDRSYNVMGQKIHRIAMPPRAESLTGGGGGHRAKRPIDYNVMGQKLCPIVISKRQDVCTDHRPQNVIGQPLKALPPIIKISKYGLHAIKLRKGSVL